MTQVIEPVQLVTHIQRFGPGERVAEPQPADFILTHGRSFYSKLIRFGQALRFLGADRKYARWNHTAIFTDRNGTIIEALGAGVTQRTIADYTLRLLLAEIARDAAVFQIARNVGRVVQARLWLRLEQIKDAVRQS